MENQRVRLTKKLFKNSLIELLKESSIYTISVTELCKKAELNRSTFYKYYENIFDVMADIEYDVINEGGNCIKEINGKNINDIYKSVNELLLNIKENKDAYFVIINQENDSEFYKNMLEKVVDFFKYQTAMLNINIKENENYIYSYIISGSASVIKNWINLNCDKPSMEISKLICDTAYKILEIKK